MLTGQLCGEGGTSWQSEVIPMFDKIVPYMPRPGVGPFCLVVQLLEKRER